MNHLVFVTGTLAVLSQTLHSLVYESHILLIDVETQQAQSPCGAATDAVQKLEGLTDQIVVVLVVLVAQEVLRRNKEKWKFNAGKSFFYQESSHVLEFAKPRAVSHCLKTQVEIFWEKLGSENKMTNDWCSFIITKFPVNF